MTSTNPQNLLGEYCVSQDDRIVTFTAPNTKRKAMMTLAIAFTTLPLLLIPLLIYSAQTHHPFVVLLQIILMIVSTFGIGVSMFLSVGSNTATFDLQNRTYERVLWGTPLLHGLGPSAGLGNPLKKKTVVGEMEEISGIRIERLADRKASHGLFLIWADEAQPPLAVGTVKTEADAQELAARIAAAMQLPVLTP